MGKLICEQGFIRFKGDAEWEGPHMEYTESSTIAWAARSVVMDYCTPDGSSIELWGDDFEEAVDDCVKNMQDWKAQELVDLHEARMIKELEEDYKRNQTK